MALRRDVEMVRIEPLEQLDWPGGQQLQVQVQAIAGHHRGWVIDMAPVEFMDSAGLVALIYCLRMAREADVKLAICSLRPAIRVIFDISKLDRAFVIFDTYEAAATYCQPPETKVVKFSLGVA